MGSRTILNTVKSSRTGTLPCVRAIWGAWGLRPAAAREAEASVPALAEVLVDLGPLLREGDLPAVEVSWGADHRWFSAAGKSASRSSGARCARTPGRART